TAQELIIQSGFESGTAPETSLTRSGAQGDIHGFDPNLVPPNDWDAVENSPRFENIFLNFIGLPTDNYAEIVDDPAGKENKVLKFTSERDTSAMAQTSRCQLELKMNPGHSMPALFSRTRIYIDPAVDLTLGEDSITNKWIMFSEMRDNFRIALYWYPHPSKPDDYIWAMEGSDYSKAAGYTNEWPTQRNLTAPTPVGEWFSLETYYQRGPVGVGRIYVAIIREGEPKQVVFDFSNQRVQNSTNPKDFSRWQGLKMYTSKEALNFLNNRGTPMTVYFDDFEFWSGFPAK
ncbi:MAG: hypothetical protein AAGF67_09270, partial [Verrucomicrobiota bacterium]